MKDGPLVSICIPNYNNAEYVGEAIQSALDQTYNDIEVIVVDNCSTDNSWEVINTYSSDLRVKIYQNKTNIGMVGNFREALSKANGEFISFLCSDDLLLNQSMEKLILLLVDNVDCSFAFGQVKYTGEREGVTQLTFPKNLYKGDWVKKSIKKGSNLSFLVGTVFRYNSELRNQQIIKDLIFFDWYLWLKLGQQKVMFCDEIIGVHRYHVNNQTKQLTPGLTENYLNLKKVLTLAYHDRVISTTYFKMGLNNLTLKHAMNYFDLVKQRKLNLTEAYHNSITLIQSESIFANRIIFDFLLKSLKSVIIVLIKR